MGNCNSNMDSSNMGEKKDHAPPTVVFELDMHCEGCAKKIEKTIRRFSGVENVKVDMSANKLTVIGKVDAAKVRDHLAEKHQKKVEIVSPQPKKDAAGNKKLDDKPEKKADMKKSDDKKDQDKKPKKKKVEIVPTQLKKDAAANKKKPGDKREKKADKEKSNDRKDQDKKLKENERTKVKRVKEKVELIKLRQVTTEIQVVKINQELEA